MRPTLAVRVKPEAYDAYLLGLSHIKGRSGVSDAGKRLALGIAELQRALALDEHSALLHATLASAYTQRFFYDSADPSFEQKAFVEIEKSLAINPDQAEAYVARAQLVWNLRNGFQHERAIADLRRALANNPNYAEAHVELGKVYYHVGLLEQSIHANDQALQLDPLASVAARRRFLALIDMRAFPRLEEELARSPRYLSPAIRADGLRLLFSTEPDLVGLADHQAFQALLERLHRDQQRLRTTL